MTEETTQGQNEAGDDLATRIAQLENDLEAARNDVLYARADTQNVRRRLERTSPTRAPMPARPLPAIF
jgi:molecular chaperone GrpE